MTWRPSDRLAAGVLTLLLWFLVAASALYWYFRVSSGGPPPNAPPASRAAGADAPDARQVLRALGGQQAAAVATAAAPAPALAGRLVLRGIVTHGGRGAALIGIDGRPPRPVRVGATLEGIEGGWTVRSVTPRVVVLGAGDEQLRLEMPALSARSSAGDAVAPPVRPPAAPMTGSPAIPPRPPSVLPGGVPAPPQVFQPPSASD